LGGQLEISLSGKALVEDIEVSFIQTDATEAIVAFGEVSTQDEIGAVAATF
jgi:hypothetical protein